MFERFLIFARARRALKLGQFEAALRYVEEPALAGERRTEQLRNEAIRGLMQRARKRCQDGNLAAAAADVAGVLRVAPEFDGAATLKAEIQGGVADHEDQVRVARDLRQEARQFAERGDLKSAELACANAAGIEAASPEQAAVERFIEGRQRAVVDDMEAARVAIKSKDVAGVRRCLARLRVQANPPEQFGNLAQQAMGMIAADFTARLNSEGASRGLLDEIAAERSACNEILEAPALHRALRQMAEERSQSVLRELQGKNLEAAVSNFRGAHSLLQDLPPLAGMKGGIAALAEGLGARDRGELGPALEAVRVAAATLDSKPVFAAQKSLEAAESRAAVAVKKSRELAAEGRLLAAREQLVQILKEWPMHDPLRRQMDILNQQALEREDRLRRARALTDDCRLAEAAALLLGLAGEGEEGREARLLLKDVQSRMDLAAEGLAQVRRAVHGPSSSREGLRHCVSRLDEIEKIQSDLDELGEVRAALQAEIRGIDLLENLERAAESGNIALAQQEIAEYESARRGMLRTDRLDARFLDHADRVLNRADAAIHNARLREAESWLGVVKIAAGDQPALASRIEMLDKTIKANQARAQAILDDLEQSSASGPDLNEGLNGSIDQLEAVRTIWADCPRLEKIEYQVLSMQHHANAADEVERLAGAGDVRGASERLGAMPPTPGFLRTRIFDIKQSLAKAQGLEQGFLLRVDEGGEYLVIREDSITIGNVRDGKADVRLLANIAGLHARLRRSLSFHGGMEDRIVAEKGEVFVNGEKVESQALRSGDRVRLGPSFEFVYSIPGKRSLTAALHLKSGFQVAGTDKILLMKDRGRDGRILIGRAADAHIRVPQDESEVEIHSASDGQIRVRYSGKGDMGGRPFSGAHPVTAGELVRCGDTSFVLQPWTT